MEIGSLYNTAKNFAETLKHSRPELTNYDACLCLIVADSGDIYSGVSSVSINEGTVQEVPAERIAVMSAITAKHVIAKQLIVISLDDYSYFKPEDEAIALLVNASVDNGSCQVVLSPDETATAASLAPASAVSDFLSGYDETPEQLGAPAEFASGFDVDSTNPFNNGEADNKADSLNSLYEHPEEAQQMGASGFPNVYAQQGYPQQQQGFPQQQGYPQLPSAAGLSSAAWLPSAAGLPSAGLSSAAGLPSAGLSSAGLPSACTLRRRNAELNVSAEYECSPIQTGLYRSIAPRRQYVSAAAPAERKRYPYFQALGRERFQEASQ